MWSRLRTSFKKPAAKKSSGDTAEKKKDDVETKDGIDKGTMVKGAAGVGGLGLGMAAGAGAAEAMESLSAALVGGAMPAVIVALVVVAVGVVAVWLAKRAKNADE